MAKKEEILDRVAVEILEAGNNQNSPLSTLLLFLRPSATLRPRSRRLPTDKSDSSRIKENSRGSA